MKNAITMVWGVFDRSLFVRKKNKRALFNPHQKIPNNGAVQQ